MIHKYSSFFCYLLQSRVHAGIFVTNMCISMLSLLLPVMKNEIGRVMSQDRENLKSLKIKRFHQIWGN